MTDIAIPEDFVARVLARCDEVGDCLLWTGAMNNGTSPVIGINNRVYAIRRLMWLAMGKTLTPGRHLCASCGHVACVAPEHAFQKKRGIAPGTKKTAAVRSNMARARQRWAALTWDDVHEIRASDESARVIAERRGMSVDHIRRVRKGAHWSTTLSSPFAGLMPVMYERIKE